MKVKQIILGAVVIALSFFLSASGTVFADGTVVCPEGSKRAGETVSSLTLCNIKEENTVMPTARNIINIVTAVVGIITVIVIIYGGFQYLTSAGEGQKVLKARNSIIYGVIGLVISLLAYAIVNFVLSSL